MIHRKELIHPLNGRKYILMGINKNIRLSFCKQLNVYGVKSWFSDRIWLIDGKVKILL